MDWVFFRSFLHMNRETCLHFLMTTQCGIRRKTPSRRRQSKWANFYWTNTFIFFSLEIFCCVIDLTSEFVRLEVNKKKNKWCNGYKQTHTNWWSILWHSSICTSFSLREKNSLPTEYVHFDIKKILWEYLLSTMFMCNKIEWNTRSGGPTNSQSFSKKKKQNQ